MSNHKAMNIYKVNYHASWGYGAYEEQDLIVVANTKSEALGLSLDEIPNAKANNITIEQIDVSAVGAHYISGRGS